MEKENKKSLKVKTTKNLNSNFLKVMPKNGTTSRDIFKNNKELVNIENLTLSLYIDKKHKRSKKIINNVSLTVREQEVLGIIGESGSGKTVLTTTLTGMNSNIQNVEEGKILIDNVDVTNYTEDNWVDSRLRGSFVSTVFQNPLSSLNPYRKIGPQIIESILMNSPKSMTKAQAYDEAIKLLDSVMISNPIEIMRMYPHQMSGGMNQKIVIVIILALKSKIIIFDEPTTALDPISQAQVIEIIRNIKTNLKIGMIIISHDISLVSSIADRICIMYAGEIVEEGLTKEMVNFPLHPYTWGLINSIPDIENPDTLETIKGRVPDDISSIKGDAFALRSDYALGIDFEKKPPKFQISPTHFVYSWLYHKDAPKFDPPKQIKRRWEIYAKKTRK